jgi:uncharacterized membrane protein
MKRHFITGLVVLLPLALTFWIVSFIIDLFTHPFLGFAQKTFAALGWDKVSFLFLSPEDVVNLASKVLILIFLFVVIMGIGWVGRYFLFKYILKLGDTILHRIPVISTVYKTSQELIQTILTTTNKSFKQVVFVPYPHSEAWSIGLVTRDDFEVEGRVAVFIPTTPNPTSGFLVLFEKDQIIPLDMKVDEALRYIISCGVLVAPIRRTTPPPVAGKS